jgi:hypothetical protein
MRKTVALTLTIVMLAVALLPVPIAAQGQGGGGFAIPVSGPGFVGTLIVRSFGVVDGVLTAFGRAIITDTEGENAGRTFVRQFALPVTQITQAACEILHLELGPLHLDLLGLVVDLNRIVLDITAEPGPGNLLGNLLCAIAGLLDRGGPLQQLAALLNQLFRNL